MASNETKNLHKSTWLRPFLEKLEKMKKEFRVQVLESLETFVSKHVLETFVLRCNEASGAVLRSRAVLRDRLGYRSIDYDIQESRYEEYKGA